MRTANISRGGQVSIPADVRHRWGVTRVIVEDRGSSLVLRPIPVDPIGAALGSLGGGGLTTDQLRAELRAEELDAEDRRLGRSRR